MGEDFQSEISDGKESAGVAGVVDGEGTRAGLGPQPPLPALPRPTPFQPSLRLSGWTHAGGGAPLPPLPALGWLSPLLMWPGQCPPALGCVEVGSPSRCPHGWHRVRLASLPPAAPPRSPQSGRKPSHLAGPTSPPSRPLSPMCCRMKQGPREADRKKAVHPARLLQGTPRPRTDPAPKPLAQPFPSDDTGGL
mgnify:CR=1 FL=1